MDDIIEQLGVVEPGAMRARLFELEAHLAAQPYSEAVALSLLATALGRRLAALCLASPRPNEAFRRAMEIASNQMTMAGAGAMLAGMNLTNPATPGAQGEAVQPRE